jgi:gliding motility-associated-like protein
MVLSGTMNGCAPLTTTLDVSPSSIIGSNCLWTFGDGTTSTNCGPATHTYNNPGNYPVNFSFTTTDGCPVDTTFSDSIEVYQLPVADFTFSPTTPTLVESTINFANTSVGGNTYNWTFDTFGASNEENPKVVFPGDDPKTYNICLQVIEQQTGGACQDKICKQIKISEDFSIFVPNAFTPGSGDNYNKVFLPQLNGFDEQSYTLLIFNRWGELLFESHDASVGWDGTYGGKLVQDGTYIWKINVKFDTSDDKEELTGHVTVLK